MLVALDLPYADTTAADLRFALGLPLLPALRELVVALPGGADVRLRLLGASHQVVYQGHNETVACLPEVLDGAALPPAFTGPGYDFTAEVHHLDPDAFAAAVTDLRRRVAGEPHVLAGVFPGLRDAVTVLAARPVSGGAAWWTAHAYPQSGEIVWTRTTVVLV